MLVQKEVKNMYIGEYVTLPIPTNWLLGYRPLQENLNDLSWNSYDGSRYSWTGSFETVWGKTGAKVTSLYDGSDDNSTQHVVTTLNYSWPTVSICWWVYYNSMSISWLWNWVLTNSTSWSNYISLSPRPSQSNKWSVGWAWNILTVNSTATTWTWYFVCWTLSNSGKKIYVNGNLAWSDSTAFTTAQWGIWRLWCWQINTVLYWWTDGWVRHCAVYNRELTADEISSIYTATS